MPLRTINIDAEKFRDHLIALLDVNGETMTDLAMKIGCSPKYFQYAIKKGTISKQVACVLNELYGLDPATYTVKVDAIPATDDQTKSDDPAPDQKVSIIQCTLLPVELEEAVANGIIKAITRLTEKDAAVLQSVLYHAINGALKNNSGQTEQDRRPVYSTKWGPVTC